MSIWTGWWAERAQRAEQDADRAALLLESIVRRHHLPERDYRAAMDVIQDWRENRERRYGALPAGPTLAGNLASGGIDV